MTMVQSERRSINYWRFERLGRWPQSISKKKELVLSSDSTLMKTYQVVKEILAQRLQSSNSSCVAADNKKEYDQCLLSDGLL
jgi:hypothetical protein